VRDTPSISLSAILLICWTGADDRTIQGSGWFKSAGHDSSDYDEGSAEGSAEGSDEGSEDSLRRPYRTRGLPSELLDKEIVKGIDDSIVSEIPVPAFEEEISYASSKKKSKKSKLAAKRAMFEETLS
jgi:hypothetical protein